MRITLSICIIFMLLFSCHTSARQGDDEGRPITTLHVENQNILDMKIYLVRGAERIRIGTVIGNGTEIFVIPRGIIVSAGLVRFLAEPIGSNQSPISQEISVRPGQEIELIITN